MSPLWTAETAPKRASRTNSGIAAQNRNSPATAVVAPPFCDSMDDEWREMATARKMRLPLWNEPCTVSKMRRWLHRLHLSSAWFRDWSGYSQLSEWITANPEWPLRAFVGLLLEELPDLGGERVSIMTTVYDSLARAAG